ncbi:hypothetical protein E8L99_23520 [Phreatobacter aquaticus]|uniref:Uncharacterized protein n=1 Tax=Phreatobacter aquaticus TaxID=2570229 RepID=A0A4D7QSM3_9HYPH|nr:hypothetical protein [Phreatobacter aquaticus]QCK88516.1 hypothetical protein E8L99_23520 [Phreatobacter aquaticus]
MNVISFPAVIKAPEEDGTHAILNGFTRLLSDIQAQQARLHACGFDPAVRNAMMIDVGTATIRLFEANIKFLREVQKDLPPVEDDAPLTELA